MIFAKLLVILEKHFFAIATGFYKNKDEQKIFFDFVTFVSFLRLRDRSMGVVNIIKIISSPRSTKYQEISKKLNFVFEIFVSLLRLRGKLHRAYHDDDGACVGGGGDDGALGVPLECLSLALCQVYVLWRLVRHVVAQSD